MNIILFSQETDLVNEEFRGGDTTTDCCADCDWLGDIARGGDDFELVNNAVTGHYWELGGGRGFGWYAIGRWS